MNHGAQNSTGNPASAAAATATAALPRTDPVVFSNGKQRRKDNDTRKVDKKKRALPQEAKQAKRMKEVKEELGSTGEELKQFNAALFNIQSEMIETRMGLQLLLQNMARQNELIVDILDAIEEGDSVKVDDLAQILFSI